MRSLPTLIRLAKRDLEDKSQTLHALLDKKEQLLSRINAMESQLEQEKKRVEDMPEASYTLLHYIARVREEQARIREMVDQMEKTIQDAMAAVEEAFGETKRYEILLEKKQQEEEAEQKRKETIMLDEISSNLHQRKGS